MFIPQNVRDDEEKNRISDRPPPALHPSGTPSSENAPADDGPQGEHLFNYVFDCLNQGSSKAEVRKQLIAFGHSAEEAKQVVEDAAEWRRRNAMQPYPDSPIINTGAGSGNTNMLIGGGICLLGIVITVGSCLATGEGGGRYIVAWGAIVFGAIQFFRGMSQSNQS